MFYVCVCICVWFVFVWFACDVLCDAVWYVHFRVMMRFVCVACFVVCVSWHMFVRFGLFLCAVLWLVFVLCSVVVECVLFCLMCVIRL